MTLRNRRRTHDFAKVRIFRITAIRGAQCCGRSEGQDCGLNAQTLGGRTFTILRYIGTARTLRYIEG